MIRPTEEEYHTALEAAEKMREQDDDEYFVARSLLNLHERVIALEHVLSAAKEFLHTGQAAQEHNLLLKAINEADKASRFIEEGHHIDDSHDRFL
jgi:hypothetical protein